MDILNKFQDFCYENNFMCPVDCEIFDENDNVIEEIKCDEGGVWIDELFLFCCSYGNTIQVKWLCDNGLEIKKNIKHNMVVNCCLSGNVDILEYLSSNGFDLKLLVEENYEIVMERCLLNKQSNVIDYFLEKKIITRKRIWSNDIICLLLDDGKNNLNLEILRFLYQYNIYRPDFLFLISLLRDNHDNINICSFLLPYLRNDDFEIDYHQVIEHICCNKLINKLKFMYDNFNIVEYEQFIFKCCCYYGWNYMIKQVYEKGNVNIHFEKDICFVMCFCNYNIEILDWMLTITDEFNPENVSAVYVKMLYKNFYKRDYRDIKMKNIGSKWMTSPSFLEQYLVSVKSNHVDLQKLNNFERLKTAYNFNI
jgi:hypothetical protein